VPVVAVAVMVRNLKCVEVGKELVLTIIGKADRAVLAALEFARMMQCQTAGI
jgi:hypothetical protein